MSTCRWDREAKAHLLREHLRECVSVACKGCRPCTHDDDGNPVRHCRTRNRCTSHLGWREFTCPECLGKIRANITRLLDTLALMPHEAAEQGVNSEAANLAGPHADHETWRRRMFANLELGIDTEDADDNDPWQVLGKRERWIREDLGHDSVTLTSEWLWQTCDYLCWVLTDLARMEDQVLIVADLLGETRRLADFAESVRHNSHAPERGIPCPECVTDKRDAPRLVRHYGHWCMKDGCREDHYLDATGDVWRCPQDAKHEWTHTDYEARLVERRRAG